MAFAVVTVPAAASADRPAVAAVTATACAWIVLISATGTLHRRRPGLLPALAAVVVDVTGLLVTSWLAPALSPVAVVALPTLGLVHASRLTPQWRLAVAVAVVVAQVFLLGPRISLAEAALVDLAVLVLGLLLLQRRDREVRRSSAALAEADQLTDAVLAGIGEAVVVTTPTGDVLSTNAAAELTFGGDPISHCRDLRLRRGVADLSCPDGCPLLTPGSDTGQAEVARTDAVGTRQALLVNARAVRSAAGTVRRVVHSYRDVTALKATDRAKTLFLASTSHELKTPVAVIQGYAELLEADRLDEEHRAEAIAAIRRRTGQLTSIIDRLLLASRIEDGRMALTPVAIDLAPLVGRRVAALRDVTGRDITAVGLAVLPPVHGDEEAIATIVEHLVENAIKYSPDGGPITVRGRVTDDHVVLEVEDAGIGMRPEDAAHCFEPFWQAERERDRRFKGSGVGLFIVQSLARAMDGEAEVVRTAPGGGTTFAVTLLQLDAARRRDLAAAAAGDEAPMIGEFVRQMGVGGGA